MRQDVEERPRRRDFLGLAVLATALVGVTAGAASAAETCEADDDDSSRESMRNSLEYVSPSKTPGKTCAGCAFFTKSAATCGKCQLLLNGPVSAGAVCSSWAPKT